MQLNWLLFNTAMITALKKPNAKIQNGIRRLDLLADFHGMDVDEIFATHASIQVGELRMPVMAKELVITWKKMRSPLASSASKIWKILKHSPASRQ